MATPEPSGDAIYLDHHATTPCDARVARAMEPYWARDFGNPASRTHAFGWRAEAAVETAREQVARAIGARSRDVIFTSGATESNNLALLGCARALRDRGDHIVTVRSEHLAVLDPCAALEREGFRVTRLEVDGRGRLDADALRAALGPRTLLVSVMHANNEIGVIHELAPLAALAHDVGALFHTDAAQSVGKISVDVERDSVDLLSLSGHKLYGPKGIGALFVRQRNERLRIEPIQFGGGHERGLRSGTLPTPLCVGLGLACELAEAERAAEADRVGTLRDRLWTRLSHELEGVWRNGDATAVLSGNLNVSFDGVEGEALLAGLSGIAVSTGSACTSATRSASHVLRALGVGEARALSSLRFGLGRGTSDEQIERAAQCVIDEVRRLRKRSRSGPSRASGGGSAPRGRKRARAEPSR